LSRWLLGGAGFLAFLHASGALLQTPIFRYAEVLALAVLLAVTIARGLPDPQWALPVGFAALIVDAFRTLPPLYPSVPAADAAPFPSLLMPTPSDFEIGMRLTWAPFLFAMAVLITSFPLPTRSLPIVLGAVVLSYAIVQVVLSDRLPGGAVMPLIMGGGAAALAFRNVPAAVALTLAGLFHIDESLHSAVGVSALVPATTTLPGGVAAVTALLEFTAYLLVVASLKSRAPASTMAG
jgi:hypothetical protein